jgi:hypothetical protein
MLVLLLSISAFVCSSEPDGAAAAAAGLTIGGGRAGSSILGKHARDTTGSFAGSGLQHGDSLSKRMRRFMPHRSGGGAVGNVNKGVLVNADKHLAVGCRVAVYWRLDKVFYKVRGDLVAAAAIKWQQQQ